MQATHQAVDLWLEAHVEHAVGLVEDERADGVERDESPLDEILETARRRDDHVCVLGLVGYAPSAASPS